MSHYPQRGVCFSSGSYFSSLRKLWKLFRETNSLEFWNLQNERLQNERTGHSTLLALVLFSCPKTAFCPPQKQWEIVHGCSRGSQCQGLVWQDPAPHQGLAPGLSAVPVLGSWSSAPEQPAVQWNRSPSCPSTEQFPSFSLCYISQKERCATCAGVQTNRGLVLYHCHNPPLHSPGAILACTVQFLVHEEVLLNWTVWGMPKVLTALFVREKACDC